MKENISQFFKRTVKDNKKQVIILLLAVMLLFGLSLFDMAEKQVIETSDVLSDVDALEADLEKKLEEFLQMVDNVGKTKVCVTFEMLAETSYAQNVDLEKTEKGSEQSSEYIILEKSDNSEDGLVVSIRAPQVRGVAVACEGAYSAAVRSEVTALLTSALGISANRVYVSQYVNE